MGSDFPEQRFTPLAAQSIVQLYHSSVISLPLVRWLDMHPVYLRIVALTVF